MFVAVAKYLAAHIAATEERCRAFEEEARGMKRALRVPVGTSWDSSQVDRVSAAGAAAAWWWAEYMSLKDAISTLVDGKIRHEYDRPKAARTPNSAGIHWQKAGLRTGESQDNLRGLLKQAGNKHAIAEFDALDRRLEALQENVKSVRNALVLEVRAVRVSAWGEESQEFRFARGGGATATDIRLRPPCGGTLEECTCRGDSQPKPVAKGSLAATMDSAAAASAVLEDDDLGHTDIFRRRAVGDEEDFLDESGSSRNVESRTRLREGSVANGTATIRKSKKRRVFDGDGDEESSDVREGQTQEEVSSGGEMEESALDGKDRDNRSLWEVSARHPRGVSNRNININDRSSSRSNSNNSNNNNNSNCIDNSSGSLDEIKRQMGKDPLDLERSRNALEEEILQGASAGKRHRPPHGKFERRCSTLLPGGEEDTLSGKGFSRGIGGRGLEATEGATTANGTGHDDARNSTVGEEGDDAAADWRDELLGMPPHERAEVYEEKGMYKEALRWHRRDLAAARGRANDGDDEDERAVGLDLARALRNTGRCFGRLGMRGFAQAKAHLTEARELVGPDGPCPSPAEEQDVVLELGNLWYNRYMLCGSEGVRFFADEALDEAVRCYRECRELCVDLLADVHTEDYRRCGQSNDDGGLLRAEFNLGMALVEQKKHGDAVPHLLAVGERVRMVTNGLRSLSPAKNGRAAMASAGGGGSDHVTVANVDFGPGTTSGGHGETEIGASDLTQLYASSLVLLGECLVSASPAEIPSTVLGSSFLPNGRDSSSNGKERRGLHGSGNSSAAIVVPKPLGASKGAPPGRLNTAIDTLEEAANKFLDIGDSEGALDAIQRLVKIFRLVSYGNSTRGAGDRFCARAEALCDRASCALLMLNRNSDRRKAGDGGKIAAPIDNDCAGVGDDVSPDFDSDLAQIRSDIRNLRVLWDDSGGCRRPREHNDANNQNDDNGFDKNQSPAVVRRQTPTEEERRSMNTGDGDGTPVGRNSGTHPTMPDSPEKVADTDQGVQSLQRVGPALSAAVFGRRRRSRPLVANAPVLRSDRLFYNRAGVTTASVATAHRAAGHARTMHSSTARSASVSGSSAVIVPPPPEVEVEGQEASGDPGFGSAVEKASAGSSFASLRAAMGEAAAAAMNNRESEDGVSGDDRTAFAAAYKDTINPNAMVLSRLHAGIQPSDRSSASGTDGDVRREYLDALVLDLRSCRISDRELQVLLHAIMKRSSWRHGGGSTEEAPFNRLLLGGNPGLSVGGLGALWGPSSGDVGVAEGCSIDNGLVSGTTNLLFQTLVHLDISKCGLNAPDLIGIAPPGAHHQLWPLFGDSGGVDAVAKSGTDDGNGDACVDEPGTINGVFVPGGSHSRGRYAPVRCSLQVLALSDNPLTRVGARKAGRGGAGGCGYTPELAKRGMVALRLLIAGAPELEVLDVSGCSQLPDGPSACLYSAQVSEYLASALAAGFEGRLANIAANHGGYHRSGSGGRRRGERDGRVQISTIRLGGNRFHDALWRRVLFPLSTHPPRHLNLAWASTLSSAPRTPGAAAGAALPPSNVEQHQRQPDTVPRATTTTTVTAARYGQRADSARGAGAQECFSLATPTAAAAAAAASASSSAAATPTSQQFPANHGELDIPATPLSGTSWPSSSLSLGQLLASTVLPADAPGVEILNLTGSAGLLLHHRSMPVHDASCARSFGDLNTDSESPGAASGVLSDLFRDALMSPLCRTTHLVLAAVRGPAHRSAAPGARPGPEPGPAAPSARPDEGFGQVQMAPRSCTTIPTKGLLLCPSSLGPEDVRGFCEASSACASLRVLDLSGCDLSGQVGVAAAAAAVSCLLGSSNTFGDDNFYDGAMHEGEWGGANGSGPCLKRLSLRACRLGAEGLAAVVHAVATMILGEGTADEAHRPDHTSNDNNDNNSNTLEDDNDGRRLYQYPGVPKGLGRAGWLGMGLGLAGSMKRRRCRVLAKLPGLLDLSDNRAQPIVPNPINVAGHQSCRNDVTRALNLSHQARWVPEAEGVALRKISASLHLLQEHGVAVVATGASDLLAGPSVGRRRTRQEPRLGDESKPAYIDLSGNGLASADGELCTATRTAVVAADAASTNDDELEPPQRLLVVEL